ncbi:flavin-linked sulfhydryl oxidase Ecym_4668 [Eremothecium cymbalariae DBVPG|uniref:Sulfhydryl oxidase n=1 Tax=Eremothecium cymbalariae (strain CBS 270.75 / DBVPG 7215 / KCTC 17166 / NRRL Y-17582) TaxID=931890 RepID=G8JSG7_ERECY|nr:hypothetical protein Ecym_4668 [Eremothecium cymbalariae DBVPG\
MKINKQKLGSALCTVLILLIWYTFSGQQLSYKGANDAQPVTDNAQDKIVINDREEPKKKADSIMPRMPTEDARKELGRASWKYFHTLLARFPEKPTNEEQSKLKKLIQLFGELYPCGECSEHFMQLLSKYPPQSSSRTAAAMWGCSIHNYVNKSLKKPMHPCENILEDYDCGCGDDEEKQNSDEEDAAKINGVLLQTEKEQSG